MVILTGFSNIPDSRNVKQARNAPNEKCIRLYVEVDNDIYADKGNIN